MRKAAHYRRALRSFSDALEGFVLLQPAQLGEPVSLRRIVQQIPAEDPCQLGLGDKRGEREEHEPAFRTIAAPVLPACGGRLLERRVTAAKYCKILRILRKSPSYFDFRQWSQHRKIGDAGRDSLRDII